MKHCFMILLVGVLFCACSSASKTEDEGYYSYKTGGILEEEFDLLVAPKMDYEKDIPYEEQIKTVSTASSKGSKQTAQKPQKKPLATKVN